jgi:TolB-like protein
MRISTVLSLFIAVFLFQYQTSTAEETDIKTVAVLPFEMHAPDSLAYLQDGLRDMLASRLAANGNVTIVDRSRIDGLLQEPGKAIQQKEAVELARQLDADYVVTGSLTSLGGSMSIDAKVFSPDTEQPATFYASAPQEKEVISAINSLSWDISEKQFGVMRPAHTKKITATQPVTTPEDDAMAAFKTEHPEKALRSQGFSRTSSPGSPFITNQGITGARGFTKTQSFDFALRAMDVGDIDSDGEDDLVLAAADGVHIILFKNNQPKEIEVLPLLKIQKVHGISIADLNRNGQTEIYVSAEHEGTPVSFGVEWQKGTFTYLFNKAPWYVRVVDLPGDGPALIGQKGWSRNEPVKPGIFRLLLNGETLESEQKLTLPAKINLFDFAMADLDNDGSHEIIALNKKDKLQVFDSGGRSLWQSSEYYGGTSRYIGELDSFSGKSRYISEEDPSNENVSVDFDKLGGNRIYIPGRIIITDLNNDNLPEVIVNRNISTASRVFTYFKDYTGSEIHALAWNGIALGEIWRTRKIDGYVVDYQLQEKKTAEQEKVSLYVGVVLQGGVLDIMSSRESTVLMYDLSQASAAKE